MLQIRAVTFCFKLSVEQSFENENIYDVFMNEINMEDEPLQKLGKNASFQIEWSRTLKNNEKKIWKNTCIKNNILETK